MRTYAFLLLLFGSTISISQNCDYTLFGTVIDLHDRSLLVGATLVIAGTEQATQTDLDGKFTFTNLCSGSYSIQVSHPNCSTRGFTFNVSEDTEKTFRLEHHLEELNLVTVEGKSFEEKLKTLKESAIAKDDLDRFSTGSLGDALNSISGVSSLNTGNTVVKPVINGLHSSRVLIINNGVRMEDQEWGAEHAPNIDINSADKITVIKGAAALQYGGDAVGGVVVAEVAKVPVKDTIFGKTLFSAVTNGRGTTFTSQLTKSYINGWYATVQGTLKRFGDFNAPDYVLSNTGAFERNASVRVGLNRFNYGVEAYYSMFKNEIGILRASHLGGAQDQIRAIESEKPLVIEEFTYTIDVPKQYVSHHLARVKGFKKFEFGKLSLQYDFQRNDRFEYDIRRGDDSLKPSVDLQLDTHTLMLDLKINFTERAKLKLGVLGKYQNNFANPDTDVRRLIPDYKKYDLGLYTIIDYGLTENLTLEAGGRFDYTYMDVFKFYRTSFWKSRNYDDLFPELVVEELNNQVLTHPQLYFYNASATFGTTFSFGEHYDLFFNYSLASRAPNPSELFSEGLHHSASRIELGDLRFNSEIGNKLSLTFQRKNEIFSFTINPYFHLIKDFIVIEPTGVQQTVRGSFQVWEYRQTDARLLGIDIDASYAFAKNLHYSHQFSLVKGHEGRTDLPLINIPPANMKNEIVFQNKNLKNLRISVQSNYVFRQNEYPDTNFEIFIPETETWKTVDVSTPPEAYHLLNFNSSIDLAVNTNSTLTVGVAITNFLDSPYRNYLNRLRYFADDLGRNFLMNLKLNY